MALKATIYKADLTVSNMDHGYYANHSLTLAQHPSETLERFMLRLAVFALHANDTLAFTKGICCDDEPDLWQKNYSDEIENWIELGEPDEKRVRKACGRADQVWIYCYSAHVKELWWKQNKDKFARFDNLNIINIANTVLEELVPLCTRSMQLTATIQDQTLWLSDNHHNVQIQPEILQYSRALS